jgi:hypothetical protein
MSGKDLLKLLLISFGFNKEVSVSIYKGDDNWIGYTVHASNGNVIYEESNCDGLMFHIHELLCFMDKHNIKPTLLRQESDLPIKMILKMSEEELETLETI